jgi:hypothetical protein
MLGQIVLITGIVWVFCATVYVVSEMTTISDSSAAFCRRLNQAIMIEWLSQILMALCLVVGGYLWFGIFMFQVGCWHAVKHLQVGDPLTPCEITKPKLRDSKTRFYTIKLVGYGFIFVSLAFHTGVLMIDSLMAHPLRDLMAAVPSVAV